MKYMQYEYLDKTREFDERKSCQPMCVSKGIFPEDITLFHTSPDTFST